MLQPEGRHADRAMAAHRQAAGGFDEQDAAVHVLARGRVEEAARRHVVAAWFEAKAGADPVKARQEILAPLDHAGAAQQGRAADDEADRIAGRMPVDAEKGVAH